MLVIWAKKVLFDEWEQTLKYPHWLNEREDYYEIESDLIQESSMSAPKIFGIFITNSTDTDKALANITKDFCKRKIND